MDALRRWFMAPQPLHALVVARVLLGSSLFACYAGRAGVVQDYWGPNGFAGAAFASRVGAGSPFGDGFPFFTPLTALRFLPSDTAIWALWLLLVAASLAFALGASTRTAGVVALVLHVLFLARNPFAYNGAWAQYAIGPLLYVVIAPSGRFWSIDAWRSGTGRDPDVWSPGWPLRLLQIQTACLYLAAGLARVDKTSWLNGEMLYVVLSGATHSRLVIDWSAVAPLLAVATWIGLALEALAPFALWLPQVGRLWALALVGLHLVLELTTNVGMWSFVAIACVLSFVLPWQRPPPPRAQESTA